MSTIISKNAKDFAAALQKQVQQDMKDSLYAAQQALNNTAFLARENLFEKYKQTFDIHNKNFFTTNLRRGVIVKKADRKKDGLDMSVDLTFPYDWFLLQSTGGVKLPKDQKKGKNYKMMAVPTLKGVGAGAAELNQSGRIKGSHAQNMIKYHLLHPSKTRGRVKTPHAFIMKKITPKGYDVIAKRNIGDRKKLDFYFVLVPEITVKKNWDFYGIIQKTFDENLDKEMDKALKWCLEHPKK